MTPEHGRWVATDESSPTETALRLLAAELSGDREGAAELLGVWDGDPAALNVALLSWFSVLVQTAGVAVADPLLVLVRRELLKRAGL
jgi:hypothetical protein